MGVPPRPESLAERLIREAIERGEFDDLPGQGRPLQLRHPDDPDWWLRQKIEDEKLPAVLPEALLLRRERQDIQQQLAGVHEEEQAREIIEALNERIREQLRSPRPGPRVVVTPLPVEEVLVTWRAGQRRQGRLIPPGRTAQ